MGKKITEVRNKSKEGGESFKKGAEQGHKAVSDVKQMKRLIFEDMIKRLRNFIFMK